MHRLEINLARRPAENRRRTWIIWGGLLALLAAALLGLAWQLNHELDATRSISRQTAAESAQLAPLEARHAAFAQWLQQPKNRQQLARLRYLNHLIDYKAISWTHLFQRLEKLMPMPVRLIAIQPTEHKGQYTEVAMAVDAPRMRDLVRFMIRLEMDREFSHPRPLNQHREIGGGDQAAGWAMQIVARYRPLAESAETPAASSGGAGNSQAGARRSGGGRDLATAVRGGGGHEN